MTYPPKTTFFAMASLALSLLAPAAYAYNTVGNPDDHNGADLSQAIADAYNNHEAGVTIAPGTYTLTQATTLDPNNHAVTLYNPGGVYIGGITGPFVVDATNVKLVMEVGDYPAIECLYNSNLTIQGFTIDRNAPYGNQGVIKTLGSDSSGTYVEVQNDAGYPTSTNNYSYSTVLVGNSHVPRVGTPDLTSNSHTELGNGLVRVRITDVGSWGDVTAQVGDYLVSPAAGPAQMGLIYNNHVTVQDVTFLSSPGENTIYEYYNSANRFLRDKITYGPPPPNATAAPMRSITSGMQAEGDSVSLDVEDCFFEGVGDDAFDLRGDYVTVYSVSGNTVTVDSSDHLWPNVTSTNTQPIRLSNQAGQYLDSQVKNRVTRSQQVIGPDGQPEYDSQGHPVTMQVDDLTLTDQPPGNFVQSYPLASNPSFNCPNATFINDTVQDGRAHGVIARGDGDLIQDCTFINTKLPGLLVSVQGGSFSEADYPHNVTVKNNVFINNPGMIIGGLGAPGNMNITVTGNVFSNTVDVPSFGATDNPSILAQDVVGLTITNNVFADLGQQTNDGGQQYANSQHAVNIQNCSRVTLGNNVLTNPGANIASPVYAVDSTSQQGITGMDAASFAVNLYAGEYLTITNVGANLNLDDPSSSQQPTNVQLYPSDGYTAQNWQVQWLADGSATLINQASNGLALDDYNYEGIGTPQQLYYASGVTAQGYWFIPSDSSSYLIKNVAAEQYLDVHNASPWPAVWLQASSGASTQNWQTALAPASAGYGQPGTTLTPGQYLVSPHSKCYLIQQTDGNLVLYAGTGPSDNEGHIWDFNNYDPNSSNYYTVMQTDGNLVLYQGTPPQQLAVEKSSGTYVDAGAYLSVTDDGHIQIIGTTGDVVWQRP